MNAPTFLIKAALHSAKTAAFMVAHGPTAPHPSPARLGRQVQNEALFKKFVDQSNAAHLGQGYQNHQPTVRPEPQPYSRVQLAQENAKLQHIPAKQPAAPSSEVSGWHLAGGLGLLGGGALAAGASRGMEEASERA